MQMPMESPRFDESFTLPCGLQLRNRIIRAAAFAGGTVAEQAHTHGEVAEGGVALTTVAYSSVSRDGRTFAEQLILTPQDAPNNLSDIAKAVHKHGSLLSFQLTHAGSFAERSLFLPDHYDGDGNGKNSSPFIPSRAVAPSAVFDLPTLSYPKQCNENDMNRICNDYTTAARVACFNGEADAVEVHFGHGYLLSQWLCPLTNIRNDEYGGSIENRFRFPLKILNSIRSEIGYNKAIFVKLNINDGFTGGISEKDVIYIVKLLCEAQHQGQCLIDGIVPSAGFVSKNGFYMLRGTVPRNDMVRALSRSSFGKATAMALLGRWLVPEIQFSEGFLLEEGAKKVLEVTKEVYQNMNNHNLHCNDRSDQEVVKQIPVIGIGGFVSYEGVENAIKQGFSGIQMARALIREPNLVKKFRNYHFQQIKKNSGQVISVDTKIDQSAAAESDTNEKEDSCVSKCIHCNVCVLAALTPEVSSRCPLRPPITEESHQNGGGGGLVDIEDMAA